MQSLMDEVSVQAREVASFPDNTHEFFVNRTTNLAKTHSPPPYEFFRLAAMCKLMRRPLIQNHMHRYMDWGLIFMGDHILYLCDMSFQNSDNC